jgi:hypothetical protein
VPARFFLSSPDAEKPRGERGFFYLYPISIGYQIQGINTPKFFEVIRE